MNFKNTVICFIFLFIAFVNVGFAQTGTLRGHVYDEKTGEPILYGNVFLKDTNFGTTTNEDGFFTISNLTAGDYTLVASYIGYQDSSKVVTIRENRIEYVNILLSAGGVSLGVVDISAKREQAKTEVQISKLQVSQKEIKALPSTGGDADIVQYLQVVPGVVSTGDQGGQLYIRGGSPIQNKILLDGMTIYNPFHSIGFYSIFETEIIKNVDVLTGGFNAYHGGRISAVIDIKTRAGNKKKLSGQVSASPFMVKGLIEGPIIKLSEGKGDISFILTAKQSIISETSKVIYPYAVANDSIGLPFDFTDFYSKISFGTKNGSRFNFFGFNFSDGYFDPNVASVNWTNSGAGMNFTILPSSSSLIVNGKVGYSDYNIKLQEGIEPPRLSTIREYFLGLDFNYFGNNYEFDYGVELKSIFTDFEFTNPFNINLNQFQNTAELGAYFLYRKAWDRLVIEPSLRFQYYASISEPSVEPRLGAKFNVTDFIRIKAAAGLYSQNLISTSNERDVVNLFNGFLSGPESRITSFDGTDTDSRLQYSRHLIAGVEFDINRYLTMNLEGYIKDFPQLIVVNRNKIDKTEADYVTETGDAKGIDLSLKYERSKWYAWATYSIGRVNRFDGEQTYPTLFDRRHNSNVLVSYNLDKKGDFQVSGRWNFGSGFPFSLTQGFYENVNFTEGVDTEILTGNPDDVSIIYADERNSGRLPYYHRFDVSIQKKFYFSEYVNLEAVFSVTNVYDRENIFYFDRVKYERVNQLPIIPSLGLKLNF